MAINTGGGVPGRPVSPAFVMPPGTFMAINTGGGGPNHSGISFQKINSSHAHAHDSRTNHSHEHRASNGATTLDRRISSEDGNNGTIGHARAPDDPMTAGYSGASAPPGYNGAPGTPGYHWTPPSPTPTIETISGLPGNDTTHASPGNDTTSAPLGYNSPPPGYNAPPPGYNGAPPGYNGDPVGYTGHPRYAPPPGYDGKPGSPGYNGNPGPHVYNANPGHAGLVPVWNGSAKAGRSGLRISPAEVRDLLPPAGIARRRERSARTNTGRGTSASAADNTARAQSARVAQRPAAASAEWTTVGFGPWYETEEEGGSPAGGREGDGRFPVVGKKLSSARWSCGSGLDGLAAADL